MCNLLNLIREGDSLDISQMAEVLGKTQTEVKTEFERLKKENVLLGWRPILNPNHTEKSKVRAVIEVKISPEREGGFDRLAARISRFEEVESCYLASGGYDLLAFVKGKDLHQIATFISERLAPLDGVLSTSSHFVLRAYKEQGFLVDSENHSSDKPVVS